MSEYDTLIIDLQELPDYNFIQFLRVEILNVQSYGPTFFGHVRYARNGVEQKEGLPMDMSKGIFIATLRDEQLGEISREDLEETLRKASKEITKIARKDAILKRLLPDYNYPVYTKNRTVNKPESTSVSILKCILEEDYAYLTYDEEYSEPPDILRCRVTDSRSPRHVGKIFKLVNKLSTRIGVTYSVGSYGGSSNDGENLDEVWTRFSLRKFDLDEKLRDN